MSQVQLEHEKVTTPDTQAIIKENTNKDDLVNCFKAGEDCVLHIKADPNATPSLKSVHLSLGSEEEESSEEENESVLNVVLNVAKNGLGVGIYFVAALMNKSGTLYTGALGFIACIISAVGFFWIGKACDITKTRTYEGVFKAAFGERFGWICSVIISAFTYNVVLLYTLLLGLFAKPVFKALEIFELLGATEEKTQFILSVVLVLLTCAVPISFLKKISYFKYTSCIGLVGVIYSGVIHCITHYMGLDYKYDEEYYKGIIANLNIDLQKAGEKVISGPVFAEYGPNSLIDYFLPIAILSASFNCHFNAANYYNSVGRNLEKFKQVTIYSYGVMMAVVGSVAYFSYKNFGGLMLLWHEDAPSIFGFCDETYQEQKKAGEGFKIAGRTACLLVALNVAFGIGLCLFPLRQSVVELWKKVRGEKKEEDEDISDCEHYYVTAGLLFTTGILAIMLVQFSTSVDAALGVIVKVMDIAVGIFACHIAFTLPGMMYLKVQKNKSSTDYIICITLILSGIIACVTGLMKVFK